MGTSGTDKFNEYKDPTKGPFNKGSSKENPSTGGPRGGAGGGGKEGGNKCAQSVVNVPLEDVARCDYFTTNRNVPTVGTSVSVRNTLVQGRVAIVTEDGAIVGYVPVEYNYLRRCIEQGFSYSGDVVLSAAKPIPTVRVTLSARQ